MLQINTKKNQETNILIVFKCQYTLNWLSFSDQNLIIHSYYKSGNNKDIKNIAITLYKTQINKRREKDTLKYTDNKFVLFTKENCC